MKRYILAAIRFSTLPLAMMLFSSGTAWFYQSREIDAQAYHNLSGAYDDANSQCQAAIRHAALAGQISRWDYAGLMRDILASSRILVFDTQNVRDVEYERTLLKEKLNAHN